jgi:hypothetical protein
MYLVVVNFKKIYKIIKNKIKITSNHNSIELYKYKKIL